MAEFKGKSAAEMRKLAEAATPGPWTCKEGSTSYPECDDRDYWSAVLSPGEREVLTLHERYSSKADDRKDYDFDAAFIAAANPSQIAAMCDLIEAQARRIEELEASLRTCVVLLEEVGDGSCGPHCHQEDGFDFSAEIAEANALLSTPGAS